jgi:hypothetical protein
LTGKLACSKLTTQGSRAMMAISTDHKHDTPTSLRFHLCTDENEEIQRGVLGCVWASACSHVDDTCHEFILTYSCRGRKQNLPCAVRSHHCFHCFVEREVQLCGKLNFTKTGSRS